MTRTRSAHASAPPAGTRRPRDSLPTPAESTPVTAYPTAADAAKLAKFANGAVFKISNVVPLFYKFVAERHLVQQRRLAGLSPPWTQDPVLAAWPFTNVFRVLDRNSQFILRNVINRGSMDCDEAVFRVLLFRTFNKIETWEHLERELGELTWAAFDIAKYEDALASVDGAPYNAAYIMPAPKLGWGSNYANHLRLIEAMMTDGDLPRRLATFKHLKDAHGHLALYPSLGDFMAMQLVLDLNMLPFYKWCEDEWVAPGPGARACLAKMFGPGVAEHHHWAIRYLRDNQESWFAWVGARGGAVPRVSPHKTAGLSTVDIEHALCECEKYSRGVPGVPAGRRTKVGKRPYVPRTPPPTADVPAHWLAPRPPAPALRYDAPVDGADVYQVERIVAERAAGASLCVRWTGWGPEFDTWESAENIADGAPRILHAWHAMKAAVIAGVEKRRRGEVAASLKRVRKRVDDSEEEDDEDADAEGEEDSEEEVAVKRRRTRSSSKTSSPTPTPPATPLRRTTRVSGRRETL